jgi:ribose transport system ATP-binding protein
MLGEDVARAATEAAAQPATLRTVGDARTETPSLELDGLTTPGVHGISFSLPPGEVLGIAALEGQGQGELFDALAGAVPASSGEIRVAGAPLKARHPYDAIRAGVVLVPADRLHALLPQRSVRENIAAPRYNSVRRWGPIPMRDEGRRVRDAIDALGIDTRAARQVRRLSGGNQQKVTIARWVARGVRTMLCFDPTRGIDIRTKQQIYLLLRDLAEAGAAVLLYTSELKEIQLVCDRAIVIFGGEVVEEIAGPDADEATLLRAAYHLRSGAQLPEELVASDTTDPAVETRVEAAVEQAAEPAAEPASAAPEPPADGRDAT